MASDSGRLEETESGVADQGSTKMNEYPPKVRWVNRGAGAGIICGFGVGLFIFPFIDLDLHYGISIIGCLVVLLGWALQRFVVYAARLEEQGAAVPKNTEKNLRIDVGHHKGRVVLEFGDSVGWVGMNPDQARECAVLMNKEADGLDQSGAH